MIIELYWTTQQMKLAKEKIPAATITKMDNKKVTTAELRREWTAGPTAPPGSDKDGA